MRKTDQPLRPFLTQSDILSQTRPFSTGTFFGGILLVGLIVNRVDSIDFALFLEVIGVREYCCMAVENRLAAMCIARSPRETRASRAKSFARDEPSSKRIGDVGLSRKPPKLRSWRCAQPRVAKTKGVAVAGKMTSIPQAAAVV